MTRHHLMRRLGNSGRQDADQAKAGAMKEQASGSGEKLQAQGRSFRLSLRRSRDGLHIETEDWQSRHAEAAG